MRADWRPGPWSAAHGTPPPVAQERPRPCGPGPVRADPRGAGTVGDGDRLRLLLLASCGIYLVNDARDAPARPSTPGEASTPGGGGELRSPTAYAVGRNARHRRCRPGRHGLRSPRPRRRRSTQRSSVAYCFWLKNEPIVDMVAVASGFLLRSRRRRCRVRHPAVPVVPPRGILRLAVHGRGQALRRDPRRVDRCRQHAFLADALLAHLHPLRLDPVRRRCSS